VTSDEEWSRDEALRVQAADWLVRLDGPDGEEARPAFEAWYAASQEHAQAFDRLARRWERTAFLAATTIGREHRRARRWRVAARAAKVAAGLALLALIGVVALAERFGGARALFAEGTVLRSGVGEIRLFQLADGSHVTLDTDSHVEVQFGADRRRLRLLRGRARFSVAHERGRPFIVEAGPGLVLAHGTVFDVAVLHGQTRVQLLRGAVEVRGRDSPGAQGTHLAPGRELLVRANRRIGQPLPLEGDDARWPSGMLVLHQRPLGEAAAQLNRYNVMQLRVDPLAAPLRLTGAFKATDPTGFAEAAAAALDLTVDRRTPGVLVLRVKPTR